MCIYHELDMGHVSLFLVLTFTVTKGLQIPYSGRNHSDPYLGTTKKLGGQDLLIVNRVLEPPSKRAQDITRTKQVKIQSVINLHYIKIPRQNPKLNWDLRSVGRDVTKESSGRTSVSYTVQIWGKLKFLRNTR